MPPPTLFDQPGIAPVRDLLVDSTVNEIMINGAAVLYVERKGRMELLPRRFKSNRQVEFLIETLMRETGRTVDVSRPFADFRLPDGSRVNVIIPPLSLDGPVVTIRKFTRAIRTVKDLIAAGSLSERMARLLYAGILARLNIIFAGATGTGKTTALNIFASHIPKWERIVTIEDTAELDLDHPHVVRLECRPPNVEGEGAVASEDLLRNALRMRPTRILVGEIRGGEAMDMLAAISSGHEGCLAVLHASSPEDAVSRLEMMSLSRGLPLPLWAIHKQIATAIDLVVQHEFLADGARRITRLTEVIRNADNAIELRDLFAFEIDGRDDAGRIAGHWHCSGVEPSFLPKLATSQVDLPSGLFEKGDD